jgi:NADPH-dependent 2,4-dienoyl-CoA reductase/sulfur reductase-like enzyme
VTLAGDERHAPYARPPLTKQLLTAAWDPARTALTDRRGLDALGVRFLSGRPATALDLRARRVRVGRDWLDFDALVVATGLTARRPVGVPGGGRTLVLRTLDDAVAIAERMRSSESVAILGTGILGCELASAARVLGRRVTLVGRSPRIPFGSLGHLLGGRIELLLRDHGVNVVLGRDVARSRATVRDADLVVAAIGSSPAVGWLAGSGLDTSDGILCDETGAAAPGVYAIGDVARWRDPRSGIAVRVEHQANAIAQGQAVARTILGRGDPVSLVTSFWSEILGTRILALGDFPPDGTVTGIDGDLGSDRFVALVSRHGVPSGLIGWNMPREFRIARAAVDVSRKGTVSV